MPRLWITKQDAIIDGYPAGQSWILSNLDTLENFPFSNWDDAFFCANNLEDVCLTPMPLVVRLRRVANA